MNPVAETEPYPTRDALQDEHTRLLEKYAAKSPATVDAVVEEVRTFVRRASATGVLLDQHRDRWAVQSLLDYWATVLYRHGTEVEATLVDYDPHWRAKSLTAADYPYPRLGQQDSYFDRPVVVEDCLNLLRTNPPLLVVTGPDGSGRSVIVWNGLIPAMQRGTTLLPGSERWTYLPPIAPGEKPLEALAQLVPGGGPGKRAGRKGPHLLSAVRDSGTGPTVVVVDKVEELFTRCREKADRKAFLAELRDLVQAPGQPARVILILQRGFEKATEDLSGFGPLLKRSTYPIPPVSPAELRAAILTPAQRVGLRFEPGLVERIVSDLIGHPAPLPLLRFVLGQLWERREDNLITARAYAEIGRHQAVGTAAEAVYLALQGDEEKEAARRLFLRLVRNGLVPDELIFASATRKDLVPAGEAGAADRKAIDAFAAAGLLRIRPGAAPDDDTVEPLFLPLIAQWRRLIGRLQRDRQQAGSRAMLAKAAQEWQRLGRSSKALWRGELLTQAAAFTDRTPVETDFVLASQAAQTLAERRKRYQARWFAGLGIALAVLAIWYWYAERKARERQERLTDIATSQSLAVQADRLDLSQPDLRLLLSLEAFAPHHISEPDRQKAFAAHPLPEVEGSLFRAVEANPRLRRLLHSHTGSVFAAAYSRDGSLLASAGEGGKVLLWDPGREADPGRMKPIAELDAGADVRCLAFSDTVLAAGTTTGTVVLWGVGSRKRLGEVRVPDKVLEAKRVVRCLAFNPDGTRLATGGWDGNVRLWDVSTPATPREVGPPRRHAGLGDSVNAVAFNPKGDTLAAAGTGRNPPPAAGPAPKKLNEVARSMREVFVWGVGEGEFTQGPETLGEHFDFITAIAYSPDGQWLASADGAGVVLLTNVATKRKDGRKSYFPASLIALAFNPNPNRPELAIATSVGRVHLLRTDVLGPAEPTEVPGGPLLGHFGEVWALGFRPGGHGNQLATAGADGKVILWDPTPREPIQVGLQVGPAREVTTVALTGDGRSLAAARGSGQVFLWDTATRERVELPVAKGAFVSDLAFAPKPNEKWLAGIDTKGEVALWNWASAEPIRKPLRPTLPPPDDPDNHSFGVAFSPDGALLAGWSRDAREPGVSLWRVGEEERVQRVSAPPNSLVLAAALARQERPDGPPRRVLAMLLADKGCEVLRWDVTDPVKPERFAKPIPVGEEVRTFALSPDGRRMAVGKDGGEILLGTLTENEWVPRGLKRSGRATAHRNGRVQKLAFTPDGKWLVSGGDDRNVGRWATDPREGESDGDTFRGHEDAVHGASASSDPSGRVLVASGSNDTTVRLWDFAPGAVNPQPATGSALPQGKIRALAFQPVPGNRNLAAALDTGDLVFWDIVRREQVGRVEAAAAHRSPVTCLAFAPERWLATGGDDGTVSLWDAGDFARTQKVATFPVEWKDFKPSSVAFSPDGALVAGTGTNNRVLVWDAATYSLRGEYAPEVREGKLSLSQQLALWDLSRGQRRYIEQVREGNVSGSVTSAGAAGWRRT